MTTSLMPPVVGGEASRGGAVRSPGDSGSSGRAPAIRPLEWLLFVFLPCLIGFVGARWGGEEWRQGELRRQGERLQMEARSLLAGMTPSVAAARVFRDAAGFPAVTRSEGPPLGPFGGWCEPSVSRYATGPDDGMAEESSGSHGERRVASGSPTAQGPASDGPEIICLRPETASPALLHEVFQVVAGQAMATDEQTARFRNGLGVEFDPIRVRSLPGVPVAVTWEGRPGHLLWSPAGAGPDGATAPGRLEVILDEPPFRLGSRVLRDWLGGRAGPHRQGLLVDPAGRRRVGSPGLDLGPLRALWSERHRVGEGLQMPRGRESPEVILFAARSPGNGILFLRCDLRSRVVWARRAGSPWWWMGAGLLATMLFPWGRGLLAGLPLKPRFYALFAYVLALPLLGIGLLARGTLAQRERVFWEDRTREVRAGLLALDREYATFWKDLPRLLQTMACRPCFRRLEMEAIRAVCTRWIREDRLIFAELHGEDNRSLFEARGIAYESALERLADLGSELSLAAVLEGLRPGAYRKSARISLVEDFYNTPTFALRVSPDRLDRFLYLGVGARANYMQIRVHQRGETCWTVTLVMSRHQAIREFLRRRLLRNRGFRLLVKDRPAGRWYGSQAPPGLLDDLVEDVARSGREQRGFVEVGAGGYLAMGIRPKFLAPMSLVGLVPGDAWQLEVRAWKTWLGILFLVAVGLAVLSVNLLSLAFLEPLGEVSRGVTALGRADSRVRVVLSEDDEIGRLGGAFNRMLENLDEKKAARKVQETLLPREFPLPAGFAFRFRTEASADLGGDFLDCQTLSDGRVSLVIGYAAGSGIGAAMVTGLVKAAIAHHFRRGWPWEELLPRLNRFLFQSTDHRRPVGLAAFLAAGPADPVRVVAAGHPLPLLWRRSARSVQWVGQGCLPLGRREHLAPVPWEMVLEDGDFLLVTTDGLVKTLDPLGVPFGYDRIEQAARRAADGGPAAVVAALEDAWREHRSGVPAVEDLTLFALGRGGGPA